MEVRENEDIPRGRRLIMSNGLIRIRLESLSVVFGIRLGLGGT